MDELVELEHAGWRSLCAGTGSDFYGHTLTDDGIMVLANGTVMDRRQVVESLANAPAWASYQMDDVRVLRIAGDVAALVYTGTGRRDDGSSFVGTMTSLYVRAEDGWRLALYQQTPVPAG
jgi:hypothetical protein